MVYFMKKGIENFKKIFDSLGSKIGLDLSYLIKNGNWVSLRFFILGFSGLLLSSFFAKFGSKELLGQYQLVLSTISIVSVCSFLGLNAAALEAVVHGREAGVLRSSKLIFLFSLVGIPILIGVGLFYSTFRHEILFGETLMFTGLLFPFFYALSAWNVYYEGKLLFKESSLRTILLNVVLTIFLIVGIFLKLNVLGLIAIFLLTTIFFQSVFFLDIFRKIQDRTNNFIDTRFGLTVSLQKFVSGLSSTLPAFIISFFFGVELLAVYFIAYYIISALSSFLSNLIGLYMPILFKVVKLDHKNIVINNFFAGLATWAAFIVFLKFFFIWIYGGGYHDSLELAYVISFLLFFIPLHTYLVGFFSTRRKNGLLISVFCFANIAGLLTIYFMKQYGFLWSVATYLYILEIVTTLPLLGYYFYSVRKGLL